MTDWEFLKQPPVEIHLSMDEIDIVDSEIESYLGYKDSQPDNYVLSLIHRMKNEVIGICRPRFGYTITTGGFIDKKSFHCGSFIIHPGEIITRHLRRSEMMIVILASVGSETNQWITTKREGNDIMEAFIADALGSTIVEAIVSKGKSYLERKMFDIGLKISNSYSPGYCGWNVSEQQMLFSLFPLSFCGITLTESSLMLPIKSVSALIGIGKDIEKKPYGCAICRKKDCYKRKI